MAAETGPVNSSTPALGYVRTVALVIALVIAALLVLVAVRPATGTTNVTSVSWSNPSGFCLPTNSTQGFTGQPGGNATVSLSVKGDTSGLEGCYVEGVTVDTPGFSVVSSDTPGMVGTWTPLSIIVMNPSGSYSGTLAITVNVIPAEGDSPVPQLAVASSNFQVNQTEGSLFATFVNIGTSTVSVSQIVIDNKSVSSSSAEFNSTCTDVASEQSCNIAIYFGEGLLPTPAWGSEHQLKLVTDSGALMSYMVTAGELDVETWANED